MKNNGFHTNSSTYILYQHFPCTLSPIGTYYENYTPRKYGNTSPRKITLVSIGRYPFGTISTVTPSGGSRFVLLVISYSYLVIRPHVGSQVRPFAYKLFYIICVIYNHQIADVLLSVALTDQEENVRLAAVNGYKRHPHGGNIRALLDPVYARSVTSTL